MFRSIDCPGGDSGLRWIRIILTVAFGMAWACKGNADVVDDLVKRQLTEQKIPGAAIVVLKAGKIAKAGAYGLADMESAVPVTAETIFRIQSMSKQFTAAGIMMLVEDGKLRLDEPAARYFDGAPGAWQKITLRHLLTQTSGLRDFINEPTLELSRATTDEQLLASVANRPLKFAPGDAWDYSNTNYLLLGMIIRRVSGQWYGDFLAERIFRPLGMTRTSVIHEGENDPGRAKGYTLDNGRIRPSANLPSVVAGYGGGGIQSTVLDLAKWDAALYADKVLKRAMLDQMWTPVKLNNGTSHGYGFGWEIGEIAQHRWIWHAGKWNGFAAQIDRFVDDRLTVIVLTNLAESAPARVSRAIAGTFVPALAVPVYRPIPDSEPAVTARFFDVLRRGLEGGLRASEFTDPVWAYIAPRIDQMKRDFTALGAIQKLTLVERSENNGERSYRYQARFGRTTMIFHFVLTKEDRIAVMTPELVNQ